MFGRKKRVEPGSEEEQKLLAEANKGQEEKPEDASSAVSDAKVSVELTRLKAQLDSFSEVRKVTSERFTRINEQVGELRGMIMDTNRALQEIEVKTTKSVDLVEAVHPDKLMVEVRKSDAKVEALRANIESNEAVMKTVLDELKALRKQVSAFKGVEQVVKLNDEVKKELMTIKKVQATIERHADKVETIFIESQKKFQEFQELSDKISDINNHVKQLTEDMDKIKVKTPALASKKEVENMIAKFNDFERHVSNVINLLTRRTDQAGSDVNRRFKRLEESMNKTFNSRLERAQKLIRFFDDLDRKAPKLAHQLQIVQQLGKAEHGQMGAGKSAMAEDDKALEEERKSMFGKIFKGDSKEGKPAEGEQKPGDAKPDEEKPAEGEQKPGGEQRPDESKPEEPKPEEKPQESQNPQ